MTDVASRGYRRIREWVRPSVVISISAVVVAGLLGLVLIFAINVSVPDALLAFIDGTVGSPYAIAASINRSIAFALVGIGFVIANRANLINVGGEGQIAVGGIAATAVALYGGVAGLPAGLPFIIPLVAAMIAGMIWGGIAAVLKIKVGTNEVISTLLLSFIAVWLVYWCVQSPALLRKPMTSSATLPESLEIPDPTKLPLLTGDYSFPVNIGLPVTVVIAIVASLLLTRSLFGVQLRAVGFNPIAASRAGISYPAHGDVRAGYRRRARRVGRRHHAAWRPVCAQGRIFFRLRLRRPRCRIAGARFRRRRNCRRSLVRLSALGRH